jgi:hypothetical protein
VLLPIVGCKDLVFVEVPKGSRATVSPHGRRHSKKQWKQVCENLFRPQPID